MLPLHIQYNSFTSTCLLIQNRSMAGWQHRSLLSNNNYESKICGLVDPLAEYVRGLRKNGGTAADWSGVWCVLEGLLCAFVLPVLTNEYS
jgi:hypothetical protein